MLLIVKLIPALSDMLYGMYVYIIIIIIKIIKGLGKYLGGLQLPQSRPKDVHADMRMAKVYKIY